MVRSGGPRPRRLVPRRLVPTGLVPVASSPGLVPRVPSPGSSCAPGLPVPQVFPSPRSFLRPKSEDAPDISGASSDFGRGNVRARECAGANDAGDADRQFGRGNSAGDPRKRASGTSSSLQTAHPRASRGEFQPYRELPAPQIRTRARYIGRILRFRARECAGARVVQRGNVRARE